MSDRTWVSLTFSEEDIHHFEDELDMKRDEWESYEVFNPGVCEAFMNEVNYGGSDYWQELCSKGVSFIGHHGSGYDYGEMVFVSDGKQMYEHSAIEGIPVVEVFEDSEPNTTYAKKYYEARDKVLEEIKGRHRNSNV